MHLIVYHLIWCPKRRSKVLVNQIGTRCEELLRQKCDETGWTIDAGPGGAARSRPSVCAGLAVGERGGCGQSVQRSFRVHAAAFTLRKEFPELLKLPSLWTRSYFASTAGNVSSETIQRDIEAQSRQ